MARSCCRSFYDVNSAGQRWVIYFQVATPGARLASQLANTSSLGPTGAEAEDSRRTARRGVCLTLPKNLCKLREDSGACRVIQVLCLVAAFVRRQNSYEFCYGVRNQNSYEFCYEMSSKG